ncbi:glycosyltransferase [Flammeovirga sp. SJP92]|uniref:glycosyltransferase n=1 Tax=Flammeovirga sp. SJP92 TaxID=1775430 RepID=UPI00078852B0|nr:glycosyltransferase [Flammeovirga sp. SJP92]KXX70006.1 hypothetical protein AVL50_14105 [Flammeovirga sp. SJP92]
MHPLLSIIIINHDTLEITLKCLKHLEEALLNVTFQAEIIVIDNSENSNDKAVFCSSFPQVLYHQIENEGFGRANNYGAKEAKGKYLAFVNSDLFITHNLLKDHVQYLENEEIDVVSVSQIDDQGQPLAFPYYFFHQTDSILDYFLQSPFCFKLLGPRKLHSITSLSGAYFIMKKALYEDIQGFDPDFFLYAEDIELFTHRLKGRKFYLDTKNQVIHNTNSSSKSSRNTFIQMYLSEALKWYKYGYLKYLLYVVLTYAVYLPQWLILSLLPFEGKEYNQQLVKTHWVLLPFLLFTIPRFSNRYGSRQKPLRYNE